MNCFLRAKAAACLIVTFLAGAAQAGLPSDIDVYSGVSSSGDRPNVLLILDSSANWSASIAGAPNCYYKESGITTTAGPTADQGTKLAIEKCALYNLIDALPVSTSGGPDANALFNVAIMLMNEPSNDGTYPRKAFIPLTTNNKAGLKTLIASFNKNGDKGNNADYGLALYEAYLYYRSMAPLNGTLGTKEDAAAFSGGKYVSPSTHSCGRNYIIVIGNGSPQNSNPEKSVQTLMNNAIDVEYASSTAAVRNALKAKIVNALLGNDAANWSDEMSRFLRGVDVSGKVDVQGIITHAIAVKKGPSDGDFPALMNSIANNGGGNYYEATNADVLLKALLDIFNQIQAVNSVFSSASLPVSVTARGTFMNQVYMGMFRPDADGKPRWRGNLKQYQFSLDGLDNLYLSDSLGNAAINASTGFLSPSAQSYWTKSSNFWMNSLMGTPPSASDMPDGEVVEKGAVAQSLRTLYATSRAARPVYTCIGCTAGTTLGATTATQFVDGNAAITQALLGVTSSTDRSALIEWVRGEANAENENGPTTTPATTVRPSIHGDVLHSRPAVVNYGGSTGVVVFYGANDGQLRAVDGNQTGAKAGQELWSFVPQEMLGGLKRLRSNTPEVELSTTPAGLGTEPKNYFVDGPIGVYQKVNASGVAEKVIIFVGMRRGGRQIYAFDVSSPATPKFLWKLTPASAGMSQLGQTWSEAKAARLKGHVNPVVIFGGGYDASVEDSGAGATTMGNAIYVVDAETGALLRSFTTLDAGTGSISRSIAADVALVDSDFDGRVDRAYAVDLGGQVYRVDFETSAGNMPSDWTAYRLADLSGGTLTGRKFFFPPDVIVTKNFAALVIGSGDREKPLQTATKDHIFQIFDKRTAKGGPTSFTPVTWTDLTAMGERSSTTSAGCYMALEQGEKVVNGAASIAGFSYIGTNRPTPPSASSTTCSANLGIAKGYAMPLFCIATGGSVLVGGGLPPSPVTGIVSIKRTTGPLAGQVVQKPFVIGSPECATKSALAACDPKFTIDQPRKRRYWYQETQR
jgi:type IV pilus assembly protein PilY1